MFSQLNGSADLAAAVNDVLVATQLFQPHGAPGVELLGGNAHLAPQPELPAIGPRAGGEPVVAVLLDEPHDRGDGRSSSAAKKAEAVFKIAFARRSSRFSASSSLSRRA